MATVTISLPDELKKFVDEQLANKGGDASEYIGALLREARAKERDARLEALLLEGLADGESIPVNETFWRGLEAEASSPAVADTKRNA